MATITNTIGSTGDYATYALWQDDRAGSSVSGDIERALFQSEIHAAAYSWTAGWASGVGLLLEGEDYITSAGAILRNFQILVDSVELTSFSVKNIAFDCAQLSGTASGKILWFAITQTRDVTYSLEQVSFTDFVAEDGYYRFMLQCAPAMGGNTCNLILDNVLAMASGDGGFHNLFALNPGDGTFNCTLRNCTFDFIHDNTVVNIASWGKATPLSYNVSCEGSLMNVLWDSGGNATYTLNSTDCIVRGTAFSDWTNINRTANVTFVEGTPASGQVGWVSSTAGDYRLVDDANNIAIDYCVSSSGPTIDYYGVTRDSIADAGAFELFTLVSDISLHLPYTYLKLY